MSLRKKILILGDLNSIHLQKWVAGLMKTNRIAVFSLDPIIRENLLQGIQEEVEIVDNKEQISGQQNKFLYLKNFKRLSQLRKSFQPDFVHAHYATSYGLLGSLLFFKPFYVSVWGSDVYDFPRKSKLHQWTLQLIFKKSDKLFSTSHDMAREIKKYTSKSVKVIPFGIDTIKFKPDHRLSDNFIIGTVKKLEEVYGIDYLLTAFAQFSIKYPDARCHIYGDGSKEIELKELSQTLGIGDKTVFFGGILNSKAPEAMNSFDVCCILSRSESFGVSAVEASACGVPVIASRVGGLPEVVIDKETGFLVDPKNIASVVERLEELYQNDILRNQLGKNGRLLVLKKYNWEENLATMNSYY